MGNISGDGLLLLGYLVRGLCANRLFVCIDKSHALEYYSIGLSGESVRSMHSLGKEKSSLTIEFSWEVSFMILSEHVRSVVVVALPSGLQGGEDPSPDLLLALQGVLALYEEAVALSAGFRVLIPFGWFSQSRTERPVGRIMEDWLSKHGVSEHCLCSDLMSNSFEDGACWVHRELLNQGFLNRSSTEIHVVSQSLQAKGWSNMFLKMFGGDFPLDVCGCDYSGFYSAIRDALWFLRFTLLELPAFEAIRELHCASCPEKSSLRGRGNYRKKTTS